MPTSKIMKSFICRNSTPHSFSSKIVRKRLGYRAAGVSIALATILLPWVSADEKSPPSMVEAESDSLTIVNYSQMPVYATAATISSASLYTKLGLEPGAPLEALTGAGEILPMFQGLENGVEVVRLYLSLQAGERLNLTVRKASGWGRAEQVASANVDAAGSAAEMNNGIISFEMTDGKWSLSFAGPMADTIAGAPADRTIIQDCSLDFWLDSESRGRLMGVNAEMIRKMGLIPAGDSRITGSEAVVNPDGSTVLTLKRGVDGFASDVTLTETFVLQAGQPVLTYHAQFVTAGQAKRYVANVEHGAGVSGAFGKLLKSKQQFKYDNPREPSRVLLYGKENSFTRVGWRPERCWVAVDGEYGCGIGFSTSQSIEGPLPGSVVWVVGRDFFLRLMDTEQENYPYEFSAEAPLEMGLAFVATSGGTGIWNQTRRLFQAVTTGEQPTAGGSFAIYLGGIPIQHGEITSLDFQGADAADSLVSSGKTLKAALEMDFQRSYNLVAGASNISPENPLTIQAYPAGDESKKIELVSLTQPGEVEVDFTGPTDWLGKRQEFVLEVIASEGTTLEKLAVKPAPLAAPELGTPNDGLQLTDIATFFRWEQVKGALDYEIQLSRDEGFTAPTTLEVRSEVDWPYYMPKDSELPAPGKWFWRIRGMDGNLPGEWSVVRQFEINNDIEKKPVIFQISPQRPLFTIEGFQVKDWSLFRNTIPEDIKPYVAVNAEGLYADQHTKERIDRIEYLKPLQEAGITAFVRTHGPGPISAWLPLAELEEIFQKYPNVIGGMGGETLSAHYHGGDNQTYVNRALKLCGKYGRFFYDADGTYPSENKWQALYEKEGAFLEEYGDYLIFAQKNNILHRQFVSQSSVLGLYLSDAIANQGAWEDGGWYWQQTGFRRLGEIFGQRGGDTNMPRNFWNLNFLMGISRGCAVFSFEGQCGSLPVGAGYLLSEKGFPPNRENHMAYWTTQGELTPTFHRFLLPFIRAVIKHQLVPTKEDVLKNIHLAVYNDGVPKKEDGDQYYYEWKALYEGTYGFRDIGVYPGTLMEFFPNTGRYYYIPVFPQGKIDLGHGIETLPLSQLGDPAAVRARFNEAYPAWYDGDALVTLVGDTLAVLNSNENLDESQTYSVPLKNRGGFLKISGTVEPHAYLMGKFKDGNKHLWLQANAEYPERPTELTLAVKSAPKVTITPAAAAKVNQWDAATGELTLVLSHDDGAVEVTIEE